MEKIRDWFGFGGVYCFGGYGYGYLYDYGDGGYGYIYGVIDLIIVIILCGIWVIKWFFVFLVFIVVV